MALKLTWSNCFLLAKFVQVLIKVLHGLNFERLNAFTKILIFPLISYISARDDMEKRCGDLSFYQDVANLQREQPSADYIQTLYDRTMLTDDKNLLKQLLVELSIACMSFPKLNQGVAQAKQADVRKVLEILMFYENENGNVSFSVKRTGYGQKIFHFPLVFKNIKKFFKGKLLLYFCFKAVFGISFKLEYLGMIPSYPSISNEHPNGRIHTNLRNMSRFSVLKARGESVIQALGGFAMRTNPATFAYEYWLPMLFRIYRGQNDIPVERLRRLFQEWRELKARHLPKHKEIRHRQYFASYFPSRIDVERADMKILRFLSYQTVDYFGDAPLPIVNAECQTE